MARTESAQLNIRSRFARDRASELARLTGMSATQVVEEALRVYTPQISSPPGKLVWDGPILVRTTGDQVITLEQANATIEAARIERD